MSKAYCVLYAIYNKIGVLQSSDTLEAFITIRSMAHIFHCSTTAEMTCLGKVLNALTDSVSGATEGELVLDLWPQDMIHPISRYPYGASFRQP